MKGIAMGILCIYALKINLNKCFYFIEDSISNEFLYSNNDIILKDILCAYFK
jgi:hypothetical protein